MDSGSTAVTHCHWVIGMRIMHTNGRVGDALFACVYVVCIDLYTISASTESVRSSFQNDMISNLSASHPHQQADRHPLQILWII